ncbi:MAG: hypothetical protein J6B07_00710 [Opitutales bacterium]|nr:hypothetical protein [Opitutales bacterium]
MKKILVSFILLSSMFIYADVANKSTSIDYQTPLSFTSTINTDWDFWKNCSYNYGFKVDKIQVPIFFDSSIMTNSTIMVRGRDVHKKRWGLHLFEGYAADDKSRITMLVNKHVEEGYPVGELYYFGTAYNQMADMPYFWFRVGSDVPYHSYMFSRDRAIFYGEVEMRSPIVLGSIGKDDLRDTPVKWKEQQKIRKEARKRIKREDFETESYYKHAVEGEVYKEFAKYSKKKLLKKAKDGTIFYDKDRKIVVIKIDGKWHKLETTPIEMDLDK